MFKEDNEYEDRQLTEKTSGEINLSPDASSGIGVPILGIDLGSRQIRVVAGFVDENSRLEIAGLRETESNGITNGFIDDQDVLVEAIRETLGELSIFLSKEIKEAYISVPGNHLKRFTFGSGFVRRDSGKSITQDELDGYIKQTIEQIELTAGDQLVHFYPQKFMIDGKGSFTNPMGLKGKEIETELQIVTGAIANMRSIINCLNKAGLSVAGLIPSYMAMADAALSDEEKQEGVSLLDIGSSSTQIVIYKDGCLRYSNVIPFGSAIITEDIKNGLLINRKEAEVLKIKSGSALSNKVKENEISTVRLNGEPKETSVKNLARIIQARIEEILDMVMLEIKNSGLEKDLLKGMVLCGGGAQLKNLDHLVRRCTGFEVRIGYPVQKLAGGIDMEFRNPAYSTCIGLLLKGYKILKSGISVEAENRELIK